jgi:subtilase family serine protease
MGLRIGLALVAALAVAAPGAHAASASATIGNHTPQFVSTAKRLGPENPEKVVSITLWMHLRNESAFHQRVEEIDTPGSRNFKHFLTPAEFEAEYAPRSAEIAAVKSFLTSHNLAVRSVGAKNLYVKAEGRLGDIQKAFEVQIDRFQLKGETRRANVSDPSLDAEIRPLVASIGGLTDYRYKQHSVLARNPKTLEPFAAMPLASATPNGGFFAGQCFRPDEIDLFTTNGALPAAAYTGHRYGSDITSGPPNLPPCGYDPAEIQTAYGLNAVYGAGFDGTGQTVVIVDAFGSPSIAADASTFSSLYGLPAPNLSVLMPLGPPTAFDGGWATETTLDVEWSHAVAPGAAIDLVVAPSNSFDDLNGGIIFAVANLLGTTVSNSYGSPESAVDAATLQTTTIITEVAASFGISVNFSSGDDGDFSTLGFTLAPDVSFPASSPFATGVGGTSLALNPDDSIKFQTGWGTNATFLTFGPSQVADPPFSIGFHFGSGGGTSAAFLKPKYQKGIPGKGRLVPDIGYLADPFTGVELICTGSTCFGNGSSGQFVGVIGGTSLACPMFSGLWAIVTQRAGHFMGNAAPILYGLNAGITDILPAVQRSGNVFGTVQDSTGTTNFTAAELAGPTQGTTKFFSALYNQPQDGSWFVLTFGTDSSLRTRVGWDNVTGLGTPNGWAFVTAAAGH